MIPYGKHNIIQEDINSVISVLKSNFLSTGPIVNEFEEKFVEYVGAKYAVAVANGTAALHVACLASGLNKGDELLTSPMSFVASANCAFYCGAKPGFVDIKLNGLIDVNKIKINKNIKIIIPVHYAGLTVDVKQIRDKFKDVIIIEDAAHALGSKHDDVMVGSCKYSEMTIFSFHPVKHITSGEGGMITTNSKELYEKLLLFRTHGIVKNSGNNKWSQDMQVLGYNYRLSDIHSALGLSQLNRVNDFISQRRKLAKKYDEAFAENPHIEIIKEESNQFHSYHLYVIKLKNKEARLKLFDHLRKNDIFCQVHYLPIYLNTFYRELGYEKGLCVNAEEFYDRIISIPMYYGLEDKEQDKVIDCINNFF